MKLRSLTIAIMIGVIALSIAGMSAYGWISEHRSLLLLNRTVAQPPATAIFVSKTAPAVISLLANPADLANLNRLATPSANRHSADRAISQLERQLTDRLHLDYQREIAPWLGEDLTVAITDLDFDRLPQNGAQPGYLAVFSSRNPQLSRQKIQAWWDRQVKQQRLKFDSYQGVKIAYNRRERIASAIVGSKYVAFANHPKVLREAINNLQASNLSILDNLDYQQILAANNHHKIGVGYAQLPKLSRWLGKAPGAQYAVAGLNLGIDQQGLIADVAFYPTRTATPIIAPPTPSPATLISTLKYLPRQSTIAIAGIDLPHWQQQLTNILPQTKQTAAAIDRPLARINQQIGIDLTTDIFDWATGEYALAAIPNPNRNVTDWMFIAERTQPERVDAAIAHFDELARVAGYNVSLLPWQDRQVIGWTKLVTETSRNTTQLVAKVSGAHTTIADKYTIFASSIEAVDQTLKAIDRQSLLDSDRYHYAEPLITATATGYLYGNWHTISSLFPQQLREGSLFKLMSQAFLSGLPNISISNYLETGVSHITLLFQIG
jgi:Protein of unknown function (DUF3352)